MGRGRRSGPFAFVGAHSGSVRFCAEVEMKAADKGSVSVQRRRPFLSCRVFASGTLCFMHHRRGI